MVTVTVFKKLVTAIVFLIGFINTIEEDAWDWAVKISEGENVARKVAADHDFQYLGIIGNLENMYHFRKIPSQYKRMKRSAENYTKDLYANNKIIWAQQQTTLIRQKRNLYETNLKEINHDFHQNNLRKRKMLNMFNDPRWPEEWYLYDTRFSKESKTFDMHVVPVWNMNITGRGVKLTIIDDGLEHTHPDLKDNYDPLSSTDLNGNDDDPMPNTSPGTSNEHGTRCASEISMTANNEVCGVGIAYNSKIGGIRILDGPVNDATEAKALGFNNNHIDIYSASWGPNDDGKTMEQPGVLASEALYRGTKLGRNGKGNIYVWASGNGGYFQDSCSCDGYVSSIYVISVSSITPQNGSPHFTEKCSSSMCATYSSSGRSKYKLIAADVRGKCTDQHSGTSASAPYAAGIFALALEMNPKLTWRDIKHLITWTSQYKCLKDTIGWKKNAAGFWVNERFGFGLLDAYKMVKHAKSWKKIPDMKECHIKTTGRIEISNNKSATIIVNGKECARKVVFIENVIVRVNITYQLRGALLITLISPNGMNTTLLPLRENDENEEGIFNWPFNTVHNWGENPNGKWIILVEDKKNDTEIRTGLVKDLTMEFYGTKTIPYHIKQSRTGQREYDEDGFDENEMYNEYIN